MQKLLVAMLAVAVLPAFGPAAPGAPFKMSVLRAGKILELTGTSR